MGVDKNGIGLKENDCHSWNSKQISFQMTAVRTQSVNQC